MMSGDLEEAVWRDRAAWKQMHLMWARAEFVSVCARECDGWRCATSW